MLSRFFGSSQLPISNTLRKLNSELGWKNISTENGVILLHQIWVRMSSTQTWPLGHPMWPYQPLSGKRPLWLPAYTPPWSAPLPNPPGAAGSCRWWSWPRPIAQVVSKSPIEAPGFRSKIAGMGFVDVHPNQIWHNRRFHPSPFFEKLQNLSDTTKIA